MAVKGFCFFFLKESWTFLGLKTLKHPVIFFSDEYRRLCIDGVPFGGPRIDGPGVFGPNVFGPGGNGYIPPLPGRNGFHPSVGGTGIDGTGTGTGAGRGVGELLFGSKYEFRNSVWSI